MEIKTTDLSSDRKVSKKASAIKSILLLVLVLVIGFLAGFFSTKVIRTYQSPDSKLDEIYNYLNNYWLYADDYEDLKETVYENAYYGMTSFEDDPYTGYMSVDDNEEFSSSLNKQQYGIGIGYVDSDGILIINNVFKDSGAEKAGIEKGDILVSVNGLSTDGMSSDDLKAEVLGAEGSYVSVVVNRNNEELYFEVERGSYNSSAYVYLKDDTVVLTISSFGEDTPSLISSYLSQYTDKEKLVIDLRNNPGGYLGSLQSLAGLFVGDNKLCMQTQTKSGSTNKYYTNASVVYDNFKSIVIMINKNTASASEVFTMCLKESLDYVTVIGQTSYGKGVMQSTFQMSDGNYIKITTARWYSPNGVSINGEGIEPDIVVDEDKAITSKYYEMKEDESYSVDSVSTFTCLAQLDLKYLGYDIDRVDGYLSSDTLKVINDYQIANNLEVSNCLNYETYNSLRREVSYIYYSDSSKDLVLNKAFEIIK